MVLRKAIKIRCPLESRSASKGVSGPGATLAARVWLGERVLAAVSIMSKCFESSLYVLRPLFFLSPPLIDVGRRNIFRWSPDGAIDVFHNGVARRTRDRGGHAASSQASHLLSPKPSAALIWEFSSGRLRNFAHVGFERFYFSIAVQFSAINCPPCLPLNPSFAPPLPSHPFPMLHRVLDCS
jgi:hypothetical protein